MSPPNRLPRRFAPLAAAIASCFLFSAHDVFATASAVTNCADNGSGSLRAAVLSASDGNSITIPGNLGCSKITLTTGAITTPAGVNTLTINGPGQYDFYIVRDTSKLPDRIFNHRGTGTFYVENLTIEYGETIASSGAASGGCIFSNGTVNMQHASAIFCYAAASGSASAYGGAIFAKNGLTEKYGSFIGLSQAYSETGLAEGGGVYTPGSMNIKYSSISDNQARTSGGTGAFGGGMVVGAGGTIYSSTVSGNISTGNVGGLDLFVSSSATATISNSTISGNGASNYIGGIYSAVSKLNIDNSTIAFNISIKDLSGSMHHAAGLSLASFAGSTTVDLQSSILSNNTYGNTDDDLSTVNSGANTTTVTGSNNLIFSNFNGALEPSGTLRFACPLLGPLRNNGGRTLTHALLSHSPAIDSGNHSSTSPIFPGGTISNDQRGTANARVSGTTADMGAYEVQQEDIVFNTGFEGCPEIF